MGTPQEEWQFQYGGADAGHTNLTVENLTVNNSLVVDGVPIANYYLTVENLTVNNSLRLGLHLLLNYF